MTTSQLLLLLLSAALISGSDVKKGKDLKPLCEWLFRNNVIKLYVPPTTKYDPSESSTAATTTTADVTDGTVRTQEALKDPKDKGEGSASDPSTVPTVATDTTPQLTTTTTAPTTTTTAPTTTTTAPTTTTTAPTTTTTAPTTTTVPATTTTVPATTTTAPPTTTTLAPSTTNITSEASMDSLLAGAPGDQGTQTGIAVGAALGGVALVAVGSAAAFLYTRAQKKRVGSEEDLTGQGDEEKDKDFFKASSPLPHPVPPASPAWEGPPTSKKAGMGSPPSRV